MKKTDIEKAYNLAREQFAQFGVDTEKALKKLAKIPVSMHCWQGDDVGGYELVGGSELSGGIQATGNYPGKARSIEELRGDVIKAMSLIPGRHRLNLHACYLDNKGKYIDRNEIQPKHFKAGSTGLNAANCTAWISFPRISPHPKAADGFTLSHPIKAFANSGLSMVSPAARSALPSAGSSARQL
jgi:L-rhamnose isomerase